jgi:hypothetical protein
VINAEQQEGVARTHIRVQHAITGRADQHQNTGTGASRILEQELQQARVFHPAGRVAPAAFSQLSLISWSPTYLHE